MIYRPTCRVRLQLSLDEGATEIRPAPASSGSALRAPSVGGTSAALDKNLSDRMALGSLKGTFSAPQFAEAKAGLDLEREHFQRSATTQGTQRYPGGVDPQSGRRESAVVFECLPMNCTIVRAPSKDADTASVMIDFRDAPIHPLSVRACLVSIALGAASSSDYADGMLNGRKRADGQSTALVEHESEQELRLWSTTRFVGFAARWKATMDEGGDFIQLECVDISCVLRGQPLLGHHIDLSKPIDEGVQALIDEFVTSRGMKVVLGTPIGRGELMTVQQPTGILTPADVMPSQLRTKKGKVAKASQKSEKQNVWDHIVDVVSRLGLVPVMRGFTLYLSEPRLIFRDLENATKMVYGRNVKKLEIERKMEGITTDTIEVRSPDRSLGRVLWARYPVLHGEPTSGILGKPGSPQPALSRASKVTPNGTGHETVRVLTVRGIATLATLEKIAEATFHEMARQEVQGVFATDDIDSWQGDWEADLLDLQSGQAVQILVEQQPEYTETNGQGATSFQEFQSMSAAARQKYLEGRGISAENAARLAKAQEQVHLQSTFRAGYVTLHWASEEGVSVESTFYNFIVVREDANGQIQVTGKRPEKLSEATNRKL